MTIETLGTPDYLPTQIEVSLATTWQAVRLPISPDARRVSVQVDGDFVVSFRDDDSDDGGAVAMPYMSFAADAVIEEQLPAGPRRRAVLLLAVASGTGTAVVQVGG